MQSEGMAKSPTAFQFSVWWALNRDQAFVAVGFAIALLGAVAASIILVWSRGGDVMTGKVVGFGFTERERLGSFPVAVVRLDKVQIDVVLARDHNCRVGDVIKLRARNVGLTSFYGRPCSAPNMASEQFR